MHWIDVNNFAITEAHMSGKEFRDVVNNPNILLGFELEFFVRSLPKPKYSFSDFDNEGVLFETDYTFNDLFTFNMKKIINFYKNNYIVPELEEKLKSEEGKEEIAGKIADLYIKNNENFTDFYDSRKDVVNVIKKKILKNKTKTLKYYIMYLNRHVVEDKALNYVIEIIAKDKENWETYFKKFSIKPKKSIGVEMINSGDFYFDPEDYIEKFDIEEFLKKKYPDMKFGWTKNRWKLVSDQSLEEDEDIHGLGVELVSPPLPLKESLTWIKRLFEIINEYDMSTTDACGFHMNISFDKKRETKKVDPLKFVLFLGDKYVLKLFKRYMRGPYDEDYVYPEKDWDKQVDYDVYAKSIIYTLKQNLQLSNKNLDYYFKKKNLISIINKVRKNLEDGKYMSVNLTKLRNLGYIEVRSAGGANYHKDFEKIKNTALRYARTLIIAHDPDLYKEEYIKKIAKIIEEAMDSLPVPQEIEKDPVYRVMKRELSKYIHLLNPSIYELVKSKDQKALKDFFEKIEYYFDYYEEFVLRQPGNMDNPMFTDFTKLIDFKKIIRYMQKYWGFKPEQIKKASRQTPGVKQLLK